MPKSMQFSDRYNLWYPDKKAMYVTFIVTHQCNLRCTYCYEHNKSDRRMTLETGKKCIDALFRADSESNRYINPERTDCIILDFIGGEPLLEIELIDKLVDYFRSEAVRLNHRWMTKYMLSFSTNGLDYFRPEVQSFLEKNRGRVSLSVTLDGDKETHDSCRLDCAGCGSYDRSHAAMVDFAERFNQKGTKFTIAPGNVGRTFIACKDLIEQHDLDELHCNCVYEEGWTDEHAGVLYGQLKQLADWLLERGYDRTFVHILDPDIGHPQSDADTNNWCGGTGGMMAFDVDGSVYPCLRYAPMSIGDSQPLLIIGDCEHGIAALPEHNAVIDMLDGITRQSQSPEKCLSCPISSGCGWCSGYNYEIYGTPNKRATFICPTHIARVCANSYFHNAAYKRGLCNEPYEFSVPKDWAVPIIGEAEWEMLKELSGEVQ